MSAIYYSSVFWLAPMYSALCGKALYKNVFIIIITIIIIISICSE